MNQGESLTDSFSWGLPADESQPVEVVATVRATDEQHGFTIATATGQQGRTWEPTGFGSLVTAREVHVFRADRYCARLDAERRAIAEPFRNVE
ncbi:hypothetical protein [Halorubellus salinus]|uniref:hypothetical protein n=1 Tax=Halorubellus salinus TaxID=755309 RepID=UPI001D0701F8|nr:hypothetical protein [Halorubellus salinus]